MASMSNKTRQSIIEVAKANGFNIELRPDGTDLYVKNLVFRSGDYKSRVYIHREMGIHKTSGDFSYLKVAIHPAHFKAGLISPDQGILDYINAQSKVNRHHSSNYMDFPGGIQGNSEPYGTCYKVMSLPALAKLFAGLRKA